MGLLDRLFGGKEKGGASLTEEDATAVVPVSEASVAATAVTGVDVQEAVIVRFAYAGYELGPLFELQHRLEVLVEEGRLGEVDAREVAMDGSESALHLYGPDAEALFAAARGVLDETGFMKGARVTVRCWQSGAKGMKERVVVIGA